MIYINIYELNMLQMSMQIYSTSMDIASTIHWICSKFQQLQCTKRTNSCTQQMYSIMLVHYALNSVIQIHRLQDEQVTFPKSNFLKGDIVFLNLLMSGVINWLQ